MLQSGRLCVVVPAGDDGPPKGILLGASTGKPFSDPGWLVRKSCWLHQACLLGRLMAAHTFVAAGLSPA